MKKYLLFISLFISATAFTQIKKDTTEKKYTVSFSQSEWQNNLSALDAAKEALKKSDAPVKIVLPLLEFITKMQNDFYIQLQLQINKK